MSGALASLRVAVTRPAESAGGLAEQLRAEGATALIAPLVVISDPESWTDVDAALARVERGEYEWVLFTSGSAVVKVAARLEALHLGAGAIRAQVAAVGPATTQQVRARLGIPVQVVPDRFSGSDAAHALGPGEGRVLLPRVEGGPRDTVEALSALGWRVDEVTAYRNEPAAADAPGVPSILAGEFDVLTLASPSAARSLAALAAPDALGLGLPGDPRKIVACIGPTTAAGARAMGFKVDVEAEEHTSAGLVTAIVGHVQRMGR